MRSKLWKKQIPKKNYQYLQLGNKAQKHIVFELTPEKELNIFVGNAYDQRLFSHKVSEEGKALLRDWVNTHLSGVRRCKK